MPPSPEFWRQLDRLLAECRLVIDRPRGKPHPRYPEAVYPLDYGYLAGSTSGDGQGIDVWVGARQGLPPGRVTAMMCCVDGLKRDAEIKLLVDCTPEEMNAAWRFHSGGEQAALLITRPEDD